MTNHPFVSFLVTSQAEHLRRTKVNNAYDSYTDIKCGVAQGVAQVLHKVLYYALFFSISIFVIFLGQWWGGYYKCDIASYADDNARYASDSLNLILEKLQSSTRDLFRWFNEKI